MRQRFVYSTNLWYISLIKETNVMLVFLLVAATILFFIVEICFSIVKMVINRGPQLAHIREGEITALQEPAPLFSKYLGASISVLFARRMLHVQATEPSEDERKEAFSHLLQVVERCTAIIVSLAVLAISLYVIVSSRYDEGTQKWAFGTTGSIVGFWAKKISQ